MTAALAALATAWALAVGLLVVATLVHALRTGGPDASSRLAAVYCAVFVLGALGGALLGGKGGARAGAGLGAGIGGAGGLGFGALGGALYGGGEGASYGAKNW